MAGVAVGIDLGTSYSCVAAVLNGEPRVLEDSEGHPLQASIISFLPNGSVLVGNPAKRRMVIDASNTIVSAKRMIGRSYQDRIVDEMRRRYFYDIREGIGGLPVIVARGREFSIPEVSAFVLRRMRQISSEALGEEVDQAVITVPANFDDAQRKATHVAGQLSGMKVLRVINEPTAAALAYGFGRGLQAKLAIYDFGGGTLDVTILDVRGDVFEVLATAGDPYLGGDDFDNRLMDYMVAAFLKTHHYDLRANEASMMRLRQVAEQVKIQLSSRDQVTARVQEIAHGPGGVPLNLEFAMTRAGFEEKTLEIVRRSFPICDEALQLAGLTARDIDEVALVGGTTRMPIVRHMVGEYFGKAPRIDLNPDQVVAVGAALQAASLTTSAAAAFSAPMPQAFDEASTQVSAPPSGLPTVALPDGVEVPGPLPIVGGGEPTGHRPAARTLPTVPMPGADPLREPSFPGDAARTVAPPGVPDEAPTQVRLPPGIPMEAETVVRPPPVGPSEMDLPATVPASAPSPSLDDLRTAQFAKVNLKRVAVANPNPQPRSKLVAPGARRGAPVKAVLLDVTPHALSIATIGGYAEEVIPRNSPIPIEQKRTFTTSQEDQTVVRIKILQGESNRAEECRQIGELVLSEIPPTTRGQVKVLVGFEVDTDGMLRVRAKDSSTGQEQKAILSIAGALDEADVQALLDKPSMPVVAQE